MTEKFLRYRDSDNNVHTVYTGDKEAMRVVDMIALLEAIPKDMLVSIDTLTALDFFEPSDA